MLSIGAAPHSATDCSNTLYARITKLGRLFHQNGENRAVRRLRTSHGKALVGFDLGHKPTLSRVAEFTDFVFVSRVRLKVARTAPAQTTVG